MGIDIQELEGQVNQTIATWKNSQPRLIIIDNAENPKVLENWWATFSDMRILITSRRTQWSPSLGLTQLDLKELTPEQARELLRKLAPHLKNEPDAELDTIGQKLGFLPLALDLVGRYLKENPDLKPAEYLDEVEKQGNTLDHEALKMWLDDSDFMATDQQRNVIACFDLSWAQLGREKGQTKVNFLARKVLRGCGYCAPNEPIPVQLLVRAFENEEDDNAPSVRQALRRLFEVGLLRQTQEGEVGPTIHPLMAEYARLKDERDDESALGVMARALARLSKGALETGLPQEFAIWLPHIELMSQLAEKGGDERAGVLWNNLGYYRQMIADYGGAKIAYQQAINMGEALLGADHPNVATCVNNLGNLLREMGEYDQAKVMFERALAIDEAVFGKNHPNVADIVNNLGNVLQALGDFVEARAAYERALSIDEAVFGKEHPNVARDVNNLGSALRNLGDIMGSRAAYERALSIDEAVFGKEHPNVAIDVNNLGRVLQELSDYTGAYAAYERALSIDEAVFGKEHPNVARDVNNLGSVLEDMGKISEARAAYERALSIDEVAFGSDHPKIAIRFNNLGSVLVAMNDFVAARVAFERALAINEAVFGENHPKIAIRVNNLGHVYLQMGDFGQAKVHFERALGIWQKFLPPNHPYISGVQQSLVYVKQQLDE